MSRYLPIGVEVSDYESAKVAMRFATALLLPLRQSTDARSPSRWACRTLCDHRSVVRSLTIAVLLRALLRNRLHLTLQQMIPGTTHCALSVTLSARSVDRNMRYLSILTPYTALRPWCYPSSCTTVQSLIVASYHYEIEGSDE